MIGVFDRHLTTGVDILVTQGIEMCVERRFFVGRTEVRAYAEPGTAGRSHGFSVLKLLEASECKKTPVISCAGQSSTTSRVLQRSSLENPCQSSFSSVEVWCSLDTITILGSSGYGFI